jgi:hypothetical protein
MNSITRLILRHVVSGKVKLTPQLLQELKKIELNQPGAETPNALARPLSAPPDPFQRAATTKEKHLRSHGPSLSR